MNKVIRFRSGFRSGGSPTLPSPQLAFSAASADVQIGGSNTYPTLTNPYGVTVIWASSNPLVASIDSSTGVVTLLTEGEVQISATFNGNSLFSKQKVTYALNVEAAPIPVHEYVDLGLPSGLLWAKTNIGANNPEDDGLYFSWGNIEGHSNGSGYDFSDANYQQTSGHSVQTDLPSSNDAAVAVWGDSWRMPTKSEFQEMYGNTDSEWVANFNGTGVAGRKFMKKSDHSVFIFLPASGIFNGTSRELPGSRGYYWSASRSTSSSNAYLFFDSSGANTKSLNGYYGMSVRAVMPAQ